MCSKMFKMAEAISLFQNSWGIENLEWKLANDRKNLLEEIIILAHGKIPFQSITLMAIAPHERKRPSIEEIKRDGMSGVGGLCYGVNVFTWSLLKGLGFSVRLGKASVTSTVANPDNHVLVLVNDLVYQRDLHLVDSGCGFPTFHAIPLDFDKESPVYQDSFLEYKFIRHQGRILRMHGDGDRIKHNNPPVEDLDFILGKWRRFYSFTVEAVDCLDDLDVTFNDVYNPMCDLILFHKSPRAVSFPGQRAVIIVNNRLMAEKQKGRLDTTTMETDDSIIKCYDDYFPNLAQDVVRQAISEWHRVSKLN